MNKQDALNQIAKLAKDHEIGIDEISARLRHDNIKSASGQANLLKKLFGYLGGIFIFSGLGILVAILWDDMGSLQRVIMSLGIGVTAFVMGYIFHRDKRFAGAVTPLFLIASFLQPMGLFIFLNEYYPDDGDPQLAALLIFTVMTLQYLLAFTNLRRTAVLFLALVFGYITYGTAVARFDVPDDLAGFVMGASLLCLAGAIDKTKHRAITPFGYFVGGLFLLCAFWSFVEGGPLELSYLALNAFVVYLSLRLASRTLLFVSVLGLMGYLSYFTYEYFADVIGWPIAMIMMGFIMIGTSAYAVKLGQKIGNAGQSAN